MILFTYVISVFVIHEIEKENSIIGTLYALGVIKKQLLKYYLTVPVIVTFLAGLAGTIIGYSPIGIPTQMQDCYDYFSIPDLSPELFNLSIGVWNCYAATCCSDRKLFCYKKRNCQGQHFL